MEDKRLGLAAKAAPTLRVSITRQMLALVARFLSHTVKKDHALYEVRTF